MRKVDDIIRGITKLTTQLDKAAEYHRAQAAIHSKAVEVAASRQEDHEFEAQRATTIRLKVASLVSV